jgi:tripartite-type tricarboxylate transporter receptor subunit TctC
VKKYLICFVFSLFSSLVSAETLTITTPSLSDGIGVNAKILAKHIGKHLPNNPTVIVQAIPGAGGIIQLNHLYNIAPKDGSVIAAIGRSALMSSIVGGETVKYDSKFTWLGSTIDGRLSPNIIWTNKNNDYREYYKKELVFSSLGAGTNGIPNFIQKITNLNFKIIKGYESNDSMKLALERGEVDAIVNALAGIQLSNPNWLTIDSKIKPLLQLGNGENRHPNFKNTPTVYELIDGYENKQILKAYESTFILLRAFIAPPNLSEEKSKQLIKAMTEITKDQEYIEDLKKINIEYSFILPFESESIIDSLRKTDPNILRIIRDYN